MRASNNFISQSLRLSLNFTGIDKERMPVGYRDTASPGPNLKIISLEEVTSHPLVLRFLLLSPVDGGGGAGGEEPWTLGESLPPSAPPVNLLKTKGARPCLEC